MKNYFKKNEIRTEKGTAGFVKPNGQITTRQGATIFCRCCKEHGLLPLAKNPNDMEKAEELGCIFKINKDKTAIVCQKCGRKLMVTETYDTMQEKIDKANEEARANLHIVKEAHSWETGISYYGLSTRIDYEDWLKVKEYFHYHTARDDVDDEFFGPAPRGWVCVDYHSVEKALNIPYERTYDVRREKARKEREEENKKEENLKALIKECEDAFKGAEIPEGSNIHVEGNVIEDPTSPRNIYGGGQWWVIQDDFIWYIKNNGFDGADWSRNNIATGGAGAIGKRIKYNENVAKKIRRLIYE